MLYVFQMDVGQMLTFDMNLVMDTVSRLQLEIAKTTNIPVEKQILLVSGGHSLKPEHKVMTSGAGTDTNPVFLFSKEAIEKQEPPLVRSLSIPKDFLSALKEGLSDAISLHPSFETVSRRTKLACQIRDSAAKIYTFCNNEFKEQHLQYQGWGTVVANLEEIAEAMRKTVVKFSQSFKAFLPTREKHFSMLESLSETLELLDRIPLLGPLKEKEIKMGESSERQEEEGVISFVVSSVGPSSLLEWIIVQGQGQSLEALQKKCFDDLLMFNDDMFEVCDRQVQELLGLVSSDPHHMKELVGIERRLSELEKRLNEAKKISVEQSDMAKGFLNHQQRLSSTQDAATILPDLCKSHKQQLLQMMDRQQRIEALQNNFKKSKQEMSTNIHQRLGWVMHIETQISKLDSDLIYHMKTLRVLECNLSLLNQVKACPQVYADMAVETARRRIFSSKFSQWAESLVEDSSQLYKYEVERRRTFTRQLGDHFLLDTLFKGFDDMPPNFATKSPEPFDATLPEITLNDIAQLRSSVPELEEFLSISVEAGSFPQALLSKAMTESPRIQTITPQSQSSQTEWSDVIQPVVAPSVVKATEAPPTKFTLPDAQESMTTEYLPAVSSLTQTMRDIMASDVKPTSEQTAPAGKDAATSPELFSSHSNGGESAPAMQSVKTQTKSNSTHTDSTSPLSSNEFATADFYFDEAMPSPVADSPLEKKEEKKLEGSKSDSETIASLQTELSEKVAIIEKLEEKLNSVQASISDKVSSQREGSGDDSGTLVGADDLSGALSGEGSSTVVSASEKQDNVDGEKNTGEGEKQNKPGVNEKPAAETKIEDQASSISNEDTIKIKKLEWELELANSDLTKFKGSLFESETKLGETQEQISKLTEEKNKMIEGLQGEVKTLEEELLKANETVEKKVESLQQLEKELNDSKAKSENLEQEVKKGEASLERIKSRLVELREKLKVDIPSLKQTLADLRASVVSNKAELDTAISSAVGLVEKEVADFNASILADVNVQFTKDKDRLKEEIQQLKLDLTKSQEDSAEKMTQLTSAKDELMSQMDVQQQEFSRKYEELRRDFDSSIKDMETKHMLELELEVDKCKAEMRENIEEAERNIERLGEMKDNLQKELSEAKQAAEEEKGRLEQMYQQRREELEKNLEKEKDTILAHNEELKSAMKEKEEERQAEVAELETKYEAVQVSLAADKDRAMDTLREQLISEHKTAQAELTEQLEAQKANLTTVLEQKQLDHAHKLTELKTQFDMERESLVREFDKFKNRERDEEETQTEYDLLADVMTHTDTQTELTLDSMSHSETQTERELLSEVISLTSSASYGSEEMIAQKQVSTLTEEKEGKDAQDVVAKQQQTIDDLTTQLTNAQAKISSLEEEISMLHEEKHDMTESSTAPLSPGSKGGDLTRYQDLMQTSNTGASFMVVDKEPTSPEINPMDDQAIKVKDKKIAQLEKKLMEMSMTASEREITSDKVSIRGCDKGDLVLLCLDERHDQYVVFTVGTNLHFLHSDSLESLGLKTGGDASCRKSWILAEVVDKEYCLAKKPNNRFRVPQGTCFYRVKCKPWKSDIELPRHEKDVVKHAKVTKPEHYGVGARPKKIEKK